MTDVQASFDGAPMGEGERQMLTRASVIFDRPGMKQQLVATEKGRTAACFQGCLGFVVGPAFASQVSSRYGRPQKLEPLPPCTTWSEWMKDSARREKAAVRCVEASSAAKEEEAVNWVNQDSTATCVLRSGGAASTEDPATGAKEENLPLLFGVFDGHGRLGHRASALAARRLPAHLAAHAGGPLAAPADALEEAFRKIDDDIYKAMGKEVEFSGSTAVVVMLDPALRKLHVGCAGDSRAVLAHCDKSGRVTAKALTEDQKPALRAERLRIELHGGTVREMRNECGESVGPLRVWSDRACTKPGLAVSRSLGDGAGREVGVIADPIYTSHQLQGGDHFLLLASDGLWDSLDNEKAAQLTSSYLRQGLPPKEILKRLTQAVREEEGGELVDDTTVVLVVF